MIRSTLLLVALLVWDGMELIESMGPAPVFSFAPGMDALTVSRNREPIRSEFVTIVPDHALSDCPAPDVIGVPGGSMWIPMGEPAYSPPLDPSTSARCSCGWPGATSDSAEQHADLAEALLKAGRVEEGKDAIQAALTRDPEDATARRIQARILEHPATGPQGG